jgi:hypothetical protein
VPPHEVADVVGAEHHRERRVDLVHRHAERRRLRAVDVELQLRRVLHAGEHHVGQRRVAAGRREQLLARGAERRVVEPAAVLQAEVEAARRTEIGQGAFIANTVVFGVPAKRALMRATIACT